jgi:hypothetical protein
MNNMNEKAAVADKFKSRAAKMVSDMLIKQAEMGTRVSFALGISEPTFPINLMKEEKE